MHTFASLMYDVYQSFGLFKKGDRRADIRGAATFSSHQRFFGNRDDERHLEQKRYDEIIGALDAEQVFSTTQRREIFYKYEQLYNALMARPVFTELSRKKIKKRYALHIIPRLIALDIYKTYNDENKNSFYHHIHQFLLKDYCPCWQDKREGVLTAVRQYLKGYVREFNFPQSENLDPLSKVIENIRPGNTQKKGALDASIIECLEAYSGIVNNETLNSIRVSLENIKIAHYSLTVLLNLERQFPVVNIISVYYRKYISSGIRPNNISAMLCRYLYEPQDNDMFCHRDIISSIVDYYYARAIKPVSLSVSNEFLQCVDKVKDIVFNFNDNTVISEADLINIEIALKKESDNKCLEPYLDLLMVIRLISQGKTDQAYDVVKSMPKENLPLGYLKAAFLIFYIALRIKIERKSIRNDIFSSDISAILGTQGIYTDYIPVSLAYTKINNDGSAMISTLSSESILSDANLLTIMRSVRMYNNMVRRISGLKAPGPAGVYPESIYGLLDKVDTILGKILNIIFVEKITSSQNLAFTLKNKKILTRRELTDGLIGALTNCPLLTCVQELESLIKYLRCPGEEIRNTILSVGRKEWNLIYGALKILEEERKAQTRKTQGCGK